MDLYEIQVQLTDTSICERGFSTMNLLKTAKRSAHMGNKLLPCASSWSSVSLARSGRTHPKFQSRKSSRNGAIRANVDATRELSGLARLWLLMCNVYDMHVRLVCPSGRRSDPTRKTRYVSEPNVGGVFKGASLKNTYTKKTIYNTSLQKGSKTCIYESDTCKFPTLTTTD